MNNTGMGVEGAVVLSKSLEQGLKISLRVLAIGRNRVQDKGCQVISRVIKGS